jgi:glyoxylase-like metal-dependent hydrolase (beta-lactamase superfamily II)
MSTDPWFETRKIGPGITLITERIVAPLLKCNIWHVRGRDRDLLVDTGLGIENLALALPELFDRPITVVLTHSHRDHSGGAHAFCDVRIHALERKWAEEAYDQLPFDVADWPPGLTDWFAQRGYFCHNGLFTSPVTPDVMRRRLERVRITTELHEGDVIDLGDRAFEVLHLPGHSPGCIGLWEPAADRFYSGDAVYDGPLLDDLEDSNTQDYVTTMKRLLLLPANEILPGHGDAFGKLRLNELASTWLAKQSTQNGQ